jgi:hypothetical protein
MVPFLHGVSKMDQIMWGPFMKEAKQFMKDNFYQLVMLMAGGMSAFHYRKLIEIVGMLINI